jgi:serine/threonine-protein kinase
MNTMTAERYLMGDEIARGAMGRVVEATDTGLKRTVAVKRMLADLQADPGLRARFLREAEIAGMLGHPNIISIYDAGIDQKSVPYFTMPVVRGLTLRDIITGLWEGRVEFHRAYGFARRVQIGVQLCNAMQYAHEMGVVHRDLKPENIMIGPFGEVLIMDWGIAKRDGERDFAEPAGLAVRRYLGSLPYASPEQLRAPSEVDARADVYSLGAVLYELLALRPVHRGRTAGELIEATFHGVIEAPEHMKHPLQGRVPRELSLLCMRALSRDPRRRGSAEELGEGLQRYLEGTAPVVCIHTGLKRLVAGLGRLVDNHASAVSSALLGVGTLAALSAAAALLK